MYHTLTRKPKNVVEFSFSVPWDDLEPHIEREASQLGREMKHDGFRPGKIPAAVVRQRLTDIEILKQSVDRIIARLYSDAVKNEKLETLGKPEVSLTQINESQPFEFTITTSLVPSVALPDYSTLSVEEQPVVVTDEDITKSLEELRKMRAEQNHKITENTGPQNPSDNSSAVVSEETEQVAEVEKSHTTHNESTIGSLDYARDDKTNDNNLPPLDDEFAKSLGRFNTLDELKTALKSNLEEERLYNESVRLENAIVELLISKSTFEELPDVLLESELENVFHEFKHNIEHHGVPFSSWLEQTKKTEEEIKESLKPAALKRAQSSLIMRAFINRENLDLTEEEVREEIAALMRQYPDQKQQEEFLKPSFIDYFQRVLLSKKAMKRLKEIMVKQSHNT